jgi:hypothetical protein
LRGEGGHYHFNFVGCFPPFRNEHERMGHPKFSDSEKASIRLREGGIDGVFEE